VPGGYISSDEWARMQRSLGVERANQWRVRNGISINDEAVSPSDHFGGGVEMALPSDFAMEDSELPALTEDEAADSGLAVRLAARAPDELGAEPSSLSAKPGSPKGAAILDDGRRNIAALYEQAAEQLKSLYHAPSTGEMLISMGAALMKPTMGGFGEALGNAVSTIPDYMKSRREYQSAYGKQLAELQRYYAHDMAGLQGRYLTAAVKGPGAKRYSGNPVTGTLFDTSTGFPAPPPDRVMFLLRNANDPTVRSVFDSQYGPGASEYQISQYGGQ